MLIGTNMHHDDSGIVINNREYYNIVVDRTHKDKLSYQILLTPKV